MYQVICSQDFFMCIIAGILCYCIKNSKIIHREHKADLSPVIHSMHHYATLILPRIATPILYRHLGKIQILLHVKQIKSLLPRHKSEFQAVQTKFYNILKRIILLILEGSSMHSLGCTKFSIRIKANKIAIELMLRA